MNRAAGGLAVMLLGVATASGQQILVFKSGQTFTITMAPLVKNGMATFTTVEGRIYTIKATEIDRIENEPPPPIVRPDPNDPHLLGATVRQQRELTGQTALVATAPPKPKTRARPDKTKPRKKPAPPKHEPIVISN